METEQIQSQPLDQFLKDREQQILDLARKTTEDIVKRELALSDFELLLSVNFPAKEQEELTKISKSIRVESWSELNKNFGNDFNKVNNFLNEF